MIVALADLAGEASESARMNAVAVASGQAFEVKAQLENALVSARTLAQMLASVKQEGLGMSREDVINLIKTLLQKNDTLYSAYTLWEPDAFDGFDMGYTGQEGCDDSGRFVPCWYRTSADLSLLVLCRARHVRNEDRIAALHRRNVDLRRAGRFSDARLPHGTAAVRVVSR